MEAGSGGEEEERVRGLEESVSGQLCPTIRLYTYGRGETNLQEHPLPRRLDFPNRFGMAPHDGNVGNQNGCSIDRALGPTTNPLRGVPVGPGATISVMGMGVPITPDSCAIKEGGAH